MTLRASNPGLPPGSIIGATQVGRYELLLELASGGMATVYIGRQRGAGGFERIVAIKRMHPHIGAVPELAASFLDEARIASLIHHPNVVSVHDVHESDGERLLVMDYVDGVSLAALVKSARKHDRRLPPHVATHIIAQTLRGLHAAHEQRSITGTPLDIVHRDATPQNLLLGVDGSVRLTDFGIAKAAERSAHTTTGNVKGKFRYMAPEQAMGKNLDRRVDIFALGAVLWELLSGQRFLKGDSDAEIIHNLAMCNFEDLHTVEPSIPTELSTLVMTAVAERPEDRWSTAEQFADALDHWARSTHHVATATEVATLVNELCSPQITSRRQALNEVLHGQRPPVSLAGGPASTSSIELSTGSNASFAALSAAGPPPSDMPPAPRPRWRHPAVLVGGGVLLLGVVGLAVAIPSSSSGQAGSQPTAPSSAPAAASAAPTASAAPVEERVAVTLISERPISSVKAHGARDIQPRSDGGVSFSLPKGSSEVMVQVRFQDDSSMERAITPSENTMLRLTSTETKAAKSDTKGASKPTKADPPPDKAATKTKPPSIKPNPYEN